VNRLVVLLSGVVIPIAFSLVRFLPFPRSWTTKFNAVLLDPPVVGSRHKVPILWGLTFMPTRGQAFFLSYFLVLNVVLSAVGFRSAQPNSWYGSKSLELANYIGLRQGLLSFANLCLVFLYSSRNNVLLWVTDWSHETFLLLHRFLAGISTLQAILHSLLYLQMYVVQYKMHSSESKLPYWYWGAIATISMSLLLPSSVLPIRRKLYETFLARHIVLSILVVVGCYLHIIDRFQHQWGYEVWIYVVLAIWGFDRIARLLRVIRNGIRTATITDIDDDYLWVSIDGVPGNGRAYLYFPTLTWRFWENHPFSVASTLLPIRNGHGTTNEADGDIEKSAAAVQTCSTESSSEQGVHGGEPAFRAQKLGLTFLLRKRSGLTSLFKSRSSIPVLVESSYGRHPDLSHYTTLLCGVGGVGITAVLPLLRSHPGQTRLLWGVRNSGIVDAMDDSLNGISKNVFVGKRMSIRNELEKSLEKREKALPWW
jgi:hypothetical protein